MSALRLAARAILASVALAGFAGCYSFTSGAKRFEPPETAPAPLARSAILRVNDAGLYWGDGSFGTRIRQDLLRQGAFDVVYYPVEPRDPPEWVVEVEAVSGFEPYVGWHIALVTAGYFSFFLPVLLGPEFWDYAVTCDVRVLRAGTLVEQIRIDQSAAMGFAQLAPARDFVPEARDQVLDALALQIGMELAARGGAAGP